MNHSELRALRRAAVEAEGRIPVGGFSVDALARFTERATPSVVLWLLDAYEKREVKMRAKLARQLLRECGDDEEKDNT